jgi:hypothetical protein
MATNTRRESANQEAWKTREASTNDNLSQGVVSCTPSEFRGAALRRSCRGRFIECAGEQDAPNAIAGRGQQMVPLTAASKMVR